MPVTGCCEPLVSRQTVQHGEEQGVGVHVIRRGTGERRREVRKECDMGGGEGG